MILFTHTTFYMRESSIYERTTAGEYSRKKELINKYEVWPFKISLQEAQSTTELALVDIAGYCDQRVVVSPARLLYSGLHGGGVRHCRFPRPLMV